MHVSVTTFNLKDMTHEEFLAACEQFCPAYQQVPGLITKIWISDRERNTYGGMYTWKDKASMDSYLDSELWAQVKAFPHFANIASPDFEVIEEMTRRTTNLIEVTS